MADRDELKPCAHCGGKAYFDEDDDGYHWINCGSCSISTDTDRDDHDDCKDRLAELWNRRAPIQPVATQEDAGKVQAVDAGQIAYSLTLPAPRYVNDVLGDSHECYSEQQMRAIAEEAIDAALLASQPSNAVHSVTDQQIIERCKLAGIRWIEPDEEEGGYPGGFDMSSMKHMRALLTTTANAGKEAAFPGCSGNPASCPENEGHGCCKPNPVLAIDPGTYPHSGAEMEFMRGWNACRTRVLMLVADANKVGK